MTKDLLIALLMTAGVMACTSSSKNSTSNIITAPASAIGPDITVTSQPPASIFGLPRSQDGEIVLSDGFYEGEFKSYCLQPGTPAPSGHDAYMQAPLSGHRRDIVESILRNSVDRNDLDQRNIQLLLWSVVSGSDYEKLSPSVKRTSRELLTSKEIFALRGGVVGVMKTVAASLPESRISPVLNDMKNLFELGNSSYEAYESLAVLRQPSTVHRPEYKKEQWYAQEGGYFVRYMPSSYQRTRIQVYVPKGTVDQEGKRNGSYITFDPVTLMAIPANSNAQRLGIGAPVVDVVRKVIEIQKTVPARKPSPKPNPTYNPKGIVLN